MKYSYWLNVNIYHPRKCFVTKSSVDFTTSFFNGQIELATKTFITHYFHQIKYPDKNSPGKNSSGNHRL